MKIHTLIVSDIETGKILQDEYFEYEGPIAHCGGGGGTTVVPAQKSSEELEQLSIQNNLLKQQLAQNESQAKISADTTPLYMKSLGMVQDSAGKWVEQTEEQKLAAMTPLEKARYAQEMENLGLDLSGNKLTEEQLLAGMTDTERLNYSTTKMSTERLNKALTGTLPISPALEQELTDQETQMKENLARKLGPNWELSTPGQKAMSTLKQKADLVREEARRGEITSGDVRFQNSLSSSLAKMNSTDSEWRTELDRKQGAVTNYGNASRPTDFTGSLNTSRAIAGSYAQDRDTQTSAAMQGSANSAAATQGQYQVAGGIASAALMAAAVF